MTAARGSDPPTALSEADRRAIAGLVLHAHLAGRTLPEHLAELPDRMLVDRIARMDAKEILATLQELYGVGWWSKEEFRRAFVDGALQGWRPGTLVQARPSGLRIVSTTCPLGADVERDARACEACQATQRHAAYLALIGQVEDVRFGRLMSQGEGGCELTITFRPERPRSDENWSHDLSEAEGRAESRGRGVTRQASPGAEGLETS